MNKLTDSKLSELSEYLQSHQENSYLYLKIKFNTNKHQNLQIIKLIEEEFCNLTHLTDLTLFISNYSVLTSEGYRILSNMVLNLKALKKLWVRISYNCFLENEGLRILQDMLSHLPELVCLKLEIYESNYITAEASQQFLDSLAANTKLTSLTLTFVDIQISQINEGNINFWRGLQNMKNLEKLRIYLFIHNYGSSDLIELFQHIANLKKLRTLSLTFTHFLNYLQDPCLLDELFPQLGKMTELKSLKINYDLNKNRLNESQRKTILGNLSNLKQLEKLYLYDLEQLLFDDNFGDYVNLIQNMKSIKWDINNNKVEKYPGQLISIGQSLLSLKNLIHLELTLALEDDQLTSFLSDLSDSFIQMSNLLSLALEFKWGINEIGCSVLGGSFTHLKTLEKLGLNLQRLRDCFNVDKSGLLKGIREVSNLKDLEIIMEGYQIKDEEEVILLESILQLNQLERLHIRLCEYWSERGISKLELFSTTLVNLKELRDLKCGINIDNLDSQNQLEVLEKFIESLSNLEYLDVKIQLKKQNKDLVQRPLINSFTNLKTITVHCPDQYLNIFGLVSAPCLNKLEECLFSYDKEMEAQDFLQLLESLSQSDIRKLNLMIAIPADLSGCKEQLERAFSKLSSLEKLLIKEEQRGNLVVYIHGIKHLKQLRSLDLEFKRTILTHQDVEVLDQSLKQLTHLEKVKIKFDQGDIIDDESNISSLKSFESFANLKYFRFEFDLYIQDENIDKTVEVRQVCSLDLEQLTPKSCLIENKVILEEIEKSNCGLLEQQPQLSLEKQNQCEDNQLISSHKLNPSKMVIKNSHRNYQKSTFTLNDLDFLLSSYLNELRISTKFDYQGTLELEIIQPLRDLSSESKLLILQLWFYNLILNEEQIRYLARNFQFLTHLWRLNFYTAKFQNYYHLLFESFQYLINLQDLIVETNISDDGAISLGNSLRSMSQLQCCHLAFNENSTIELKGLSSIFSGFQYTKKLKYLDLEIVTDQMIEENSQIRISECISNLKLLHYLRFSLAINQIDSIFLKEFFTQMGSLLFLKTLSFEIKEDNPVNQDMLDELIKAMNKLKNLNKYNISIYLESNRSISLSQDFATLINMTNPFQLIISTPKSDNSLKLDYSQCHFSFKLQSLEQLKLNYLEYLNENIKLFFCIAENNNIILDNVNNYTVSNPSTTLLPPFQIFHNKDVSIYLSISLYFLLN